MRRAFRAGGTHRGYSGYESKPLKSSRFEQFKVGKSMVFRVPSQLHEEISKLAKKRDVPTQQLVREAIERAL